MLATITGVFWALKSMIIPQICEKYHPAVVEGCHALEFIQGGVQPYDDVQCIVVSAITVNLPMTIGVGRAPHVWVVIYV